MLSLDNVFAPANPALWDRLPPQPEPQPGAQPSQDSLSPTYVLYTRQEAGEQEALNETRVSETETETHPADAADSWVDPSSVEGSAAGDRSAFDSPAAAKHSPQKLQYPSARWVIPGAAQAAQAGEKGSSDLGRLLWEQVLDGHPLADLAFYIEGGLVLRAHHAVLASRCKIFDTMEIAQGGCSVPPGVSREAFTAFLSFLYTGDLGLPGLEVDGRDLWMLAEAYEVPDLSTRLLSSISTETVAAVTDYAHRTENAEIMRACTNLVALEGIEAIPSSSLRGVSHHAVSRLITSSPWRILDSFQLVSRWARMNAIGSPHDDRIKDLLEDVGDLHALTVHELIGTVKPSGIVSQDELKALLEHSSHSQSAVWASGKWRRQRVMDNNSVEAAGVDGHVCPVLTLPMGVAETIDGCILVVDSLKARILCLSHNGRLIPSRCIENDMQADMVFQRPSARMKFPKDISVDHENGFIAVADPVQNLIMVFKPYGNFETSFPTRENAHSKLFTPAGLSMGGGKLYVCDPGGGLVHIFDATTSTGKMGTYLGNFDVGERLRVVDVVVTDTDKLVVVCERHKKVLIFSTSGTLISTYSGMFGSPAELRHVAVSRVHGGIAAIDTANKWVSLFNSHAGWVQSLGVEAPELRRRSWAKGFISGPTNSNGSPRRKPIAFSDPRGLAILRNGDIVVADKERLVFLTNAAEVPFGVAVEC